jgi:hypothetical protein
MTNPVEKNNTARKKQIKAFIIGVLLIVVLVIIHLVMNHPSKKSADSDTSHTANITSAVPENMAESSMTQLVNETKASLTSLSNQIKDKFTAIDHSIKALNDKLTTQDKKQTTLEKAIETMPHQNRTVNANRTDHRQEKTQDRSVLSLKDKPLLTIKAQRFNDTPQPIQSKLSNQVTAGTYARAVLLSGADTNAGVDGQTNSIPVNLRFVSQGTLPNGYHSSLKGCFALAAAHGSVSSERGEIRLNRLSCIRHGKILDIPVQGIVVDQSGMNGLRGHLVMRNGPMLMNAGVAGFFSGVGQGLSSSLTTQSISPLGTTNALPSSDVFKYGAYTGANNALSKLADYYIKMANLYHPVIEIHPGAIVDVLFLKSFSLDVKQGSDNQMSTQQTMSVHHFSSETHMQSQVNELMNRVQRTPLGEKMEMPR